MREIPIYLPYNKFCQFLAAKASICKVGECEVIMNSFQARINWFQTRMYGDGRLEWNHSSLEWIHSNFLTPKPLGIGEIFFHICTLQCILEFWAKKHVYKVQYLKPYIPQHYITYTNYWKKVNRSKCLLVSLSAFCLSVDKLKSSSKAQ